MNSEAHHEHFDICSEDIMEVDLMQEPCKRLWLTVLKGAVHDSQNGDPYQRRKARYWLCSEERGIGSFIWICTNLELAPDAVRFRCRDKPGKKKSARSEYAWDGANLSIQKTNTYEKIRHRLPMPWRES